MENASKTDAKRTVKVVVPCLALLLGVGPQEVMAQGAIQGKVTAPSDTVIVGARVALVDRLGTVVATSISDEQGRYRIELRAGMAAGSLLVTRLGYQARRVAIDSVAPPGGLTANIILIPVPQNLGSVVVTGTRPRPNHDAERRRPLPGANQRTIDAADGTSGDLSGDPVKALDLIPNLFTEPALVAFGLGQDQTSTTLNGSDFSGTLPRDALTRTVRLSNYDPRNGRYAGVQVNSTIESGRYGPGLTLRTSLDEPRLQSGAPSQAETGAQFSREIISAVASGSVANARRFFNSSFQLSQIRRGRRNLNGLPSATIAGLGLAGDSIADLLRVATASGIPLSSVSTSSLATVSASGIVRFDLTPGAGPLLEAPEPVFYVLAASSFERSTGLGVRPMSLATGSGAELQLHNQLGIEYAPFLGSILSKTNATASMSETTAQPDVHLPHVVVLLPSQLSPSNVGTVPVELGGSELARKMDRTRQFQVRNETSWLSWNRAHTFDAFIDAEIESASISDAPNDLGEFIFQSTADLQRRQPVSYTRTITHRLVNGSVERLAVGIGDTYVVGDSARLITSARAGDGLRLEYGLRMDLDRYAVPSQASFPVRATFGLDNTLKPSGYDVMPMLGFTWSDGQVRSTAGGARFSESRNSLSGGVRGYRGLFPLASVATAASQDGSAASTLSIQCVGDAAPAPDWSAYRLDAANIPRTCEGDVSSSGVVDKPDVTVFDRNTAPPISWRGELNWRRRVTENLHASAGANYALNTRLADAYDVNFSGEPGLHLGEEGGRPLFAPASAVAGSTGRVTSTASRLSANFDHVALIQSDLRATQRQFVLGLDYDIGTSQARLGIAPDAPARTGALRVSYANNAGSQQARGFTTSTAADPRTVEWIRPVTPTHVFTMSASFQFDTWLSLALSGRVQSGVRFTPMVASDINGDGYGNDRAFVFGVDASGDTSLVQGMSRLLQSSASARQCLLPQRGLMAMPNSCVTGWTANLRSISVELDPYRIGLGNRGSVRLYLFNVLNGIDQLVHGGNDLHGWGEPASPDRQLMYVKGFDPDKRRYQYAINQNFGEPLMKPSFTSNPFRVSVDVRVGLGRDRETAIIEEAMRVASSSGPSDSLTLVRDVKRYLLLAAGTYDANEFRTLLRLADSLKLTPEQQAAIVEHEWTVGAARDTLFSELSSFLVARHGAYSGDAVRSRWHGTMDRSVRLRYAATVEVRRVLTDEQLAWLRQRRLLPELDASTRWLDRITRVPLYPR